MHDIRRLREFPEEVKNNISRKGFEADTHKVLELDDQWRKAVDSANNLKAELNKASKAIGEAKKRGESAEQEMETARSIRAEITHADESQKKLQVEISEIMQTWPAEPQTDVPEGLNEDFNVVLKEAENIPKFDFELVDHLELAENLNILDMNRGSKVTGTAFPVYVGEGATMERALINFMLDIHIREHGYRELFVPFMVNEKSAYGTGQIPKLEEDMYKVEKEGFYLISTSEIPITNLHRDEILKASDFPTKYAAYSACFRREAGAYGAGTRGLLRVHQFNKVELVQIVEPEKSAEAQQEILNQAIKILDLLELPYRVIELCAGELSFAAAKCYDIEVWSPATDSWLECSSVSNFLDFQARRMNLRYRAEGDKKPQYPHTLNGSGLATCRIMVSILENYQTPEKRVLVPRVLQPYMGGLDQIKGTSS